MTSNKTFDAFLTIKIIRQQSTSVYSLYSVVASIDVSLARRAVEGMLQQFKVIRVNVGRPCSLLPRLVSMGFAQCSIDVMRRDRWTSAAKCRTFPVHRRGIRGSRRWRTEGRNGEQRDNPWSMEHVRPFPNRRNERSRPGVVAARLGGVSRMASSDKLNPSWPRDQVVPAPLRR